MVLESKTLQPVFKPWSPMSLGSFLLFFFGGVSFITFVDMLISRGSFRLGPWRSDQTIHGSVLGRLLTAIGAVLAFAFGAYSGVLLAVSNLPGWGDSTLIGALYVATAAMTGAAALVLIQSLRGQVDADVVALQRTNAVFIVWWLIVLAAFVATLGEGARFILRGGPLIAMILAVVAGGLVPLALHVMNRRPLAAATPLAAALVLVGGLLLRYAVVMGPQVAR
jgi:formate-dependent nitrite reductase membrane component NrfD